MKVVLTGYGSRGDVEPCSAVGRELQRRGHEVQMAVTPHLVGLVESAGLAAAAYGPDTQRLSDEDLAMFSSPNRIGALPKVVEYVERVWAEKTTALTALASGADVLVSMGSEQDVVCNVADYYGVPLVGLHCFPPEALPVTSLDGMITREVNTAQRRALGLSEVGDTAPQCIEIQAYEELCFPGLAARWGEQARRRPFVGPLALELPTDADNEILQWIHGDAPPIFFGFGSTPVASFADTVALIDGACAELGERALVFAGPNGLADITHDDHVKVVAGGNHADVFPLCRAVVHHGGAGVTAAGLRAGVPALILWWWLDQPFWAAAIHRLGVGSGRSFLYTTRESLIMDLRFVLAPERVNRARETAGRMTSTAQSAAAAADVVEETARGTHPA